jgi:hypothetical protein
VLATLDLIEHDLSRTPCLSLIEGYCSIWYEETFAIVHECRHLTQFRARKIEDSCEQSFSLLHNCCKAPTGTPVETKDCLSLVNLFEVRWSIMRVAWVSFRIDRLQILLIIQQRLAGMHGSLTKDFVASPGQSM